MVIWLKVLNAGRERVPDRLVCCEFEGIVEKVPGWYAENIRLRRLRIDEEGGIKEEL